MIAYSIAAAKQTPEISRVVVSTDSEEYSMIANRYGAEVPFLRPKEISDDTSPDLDFIKHCINWFEDRERQTPDYLVHLRPTTPLRDAKMISDAIRALSRDDEATCLRSGHRCAESPFKWFKKPKNYFTTLDDDPNIESTNRGRQEYASVYIPDGYVDIIKSNFVTNNDRLHGDRALAFVSPFCVEIDTEEEFDYLEYWIEKHGSPLKTYLDKIK